MYIPLMSAIQIIAESLPISSSTHVALVSRCAHRLGFEVMLQPQWFDYLLHAPTILILLWFFRKFIEQLVKPYLGMRSAPAPQPLNLTLLQLILHMMIATVPVVVMMFGLVKPWLMHTSWYAAPVTMLVGLCITAGLLFSLRKQPVGHEVPTLSTALLLGLVQALALFPGISRFASTYVVASRLGLSPAAAFVYSFGLGMPLFFGGFLLGLKEGYSSGLLLSYCSVPLCITWVGATVLGYGALWLMWHLSERNRLWVMGWYMMVPMISLVILSWVI